MSLPNHHPIFNLPPELLSKIFAHSTTNTYPSVIEAPINVSSVCKSWRQIALSTPCLWSDVYIVQYTDCKRLPTARTIQAWISRSGSYGFSFTISRIKVEELDKTEFNAVIDVLLENCEMWRKVHITMQKNYSAELLSVLPMRTPNLRKLAIDGPKFAIANLFDAPLTRLTHLFIIGTTIHSPPRGNLLLENLVFIQLISVHHSDVVECLSRSPRLEDVRAYFDFTAEDSRRIQERVCFTLKHMQHLHLIITIHNCDEGQRGPFDHINFPTLKTLLFKLLVHDFETTHIRRDVLWDFSVNIASRYGGSTQNLEIESQCYGLAHPGFIDRFRSLKHLGIHISVLNNDCIRALVSRFSSSTKPPFQTRSCLESLRIYGFNGDDHEPTLRTIIDLAEKEKSSNAVRPVIIVPSDPIILSSDSTIEITNAHDWLERRCDLYRDLDW
ncbi:hypothetical protein BD410DRAFT_903042 [Rickenella mellea]|uniref:F-box domain-containing protein n=1 Tax=Rickenella mellea TaxID=50990 RepID=A0A4Y7PHF1_9AGAM|nr:hypothetical protein BD410DRAFT_903042 [Rickenella mellea]